MDEESKARSEIARATGKAIDALSGIGGFLDRVFGDLVTDGVGLVADRLKFYRYKQAVLLAHKTDAELAARGIRTTRAVPPKIALPLIEAATVEDDDDLHTLWAKLLATAMTEGEAQVERKYVSILADLTRADAEVLREIYLAWSYRGPEAEGPTRSTFFYRQAVNGTRDYDPVNVVSLSRLGLIAPGAIDLTMTGTDIQIPQAIRVSGDLQDVVVTPLGEAFCQAVGMGGGADE